MYKHIIVLLFVLPILVSFLIIVWWIMFAIIGMVLEAIKEMRDNE